MKERKNEFSHIDTHIENGFASTESSWFLTSKRTVLSLKRVLQQNLLQFLAENGFYLI